MQNECMICFYPITSENSTATCELCGLIVHSKCYAKWCKKKPENKDHCIYCQGASTMFYSPLPRSFGFLCQIFRKLCGISKVWNL